MKKRLQQLTIALAALVLSAVFPADGQVLTTLYSFSSTSNSSATNSDGATPLAGLLLVSNQLFGTASAGGSYAKGTVFAINTDGLCFTNLYSFTGGSDGGTPSSSLIIGGNTLYGNTAMGGKLADGPVGGTIFTINPDGSGFTVVYSASL
jgi:uncharacterized repeat protein (TIGR03803 family)